MKSIWIVKQYGSTPDLPGGTRQYNLACSLARRGYQVTFFLSRFHYLLHRDVGPVTSGDTITEVREGVRLVWIKSIAYAQNNWRRIANMFDFAGRLYAAARHPSKYGNMIYPPDVVVANNLPLLAPLAAHRIARRFGARFVLEIGDLWPQTLIDMGKIKEPGSVAKILRWIEAYLYRHADEIITPLPFITEYLAERGFKRQAIYIGAGENTAAYESAIEEPSKETDIFTLMYCGAHGPANNLQLALKAIQHLGDTDRKRIRLVMVGEGIEKNTLRQSALEMGLENVVFLDAVPKIKIPETLQQADAFLLIMRELPIYKYGINLNKLVDYLCAGKPIIFAGDVRNNLIEGLKCGLNVAPDDPRALAEAISRLAAMDLSERTKMGQAGRKYAKDNLDVEKLAERFLEALK